MKFAKKIKKSTENKTKSAVFRKRTKRISLILLLILIAALTSWAGYREYHYYQHKDDLDNPFFFCKSSAVYEEFKDNENGVVYQLAYQRRDPNSPRTLQNLFCSFFDTESFYEWADYWEYPYLKKVIAKFNATEAFWYEIRNDDNQEIIKALTEAGVDVNAKDEDGDTPLHLVQSAETAQLFIDKGADVNAKDEDDETPLHFAKNAEIAKILIEAGTDVNVKNNSGTTPLHLVKSAEIAQLLIDKGADVNAKNKWSDTPLHLVVYQTDVAKILIDKGADVNAKNNDGKTPSDLAKSLRSVDVIVDVYE